MESLERLRKRISEIVDGLNATYTTTESYETYGKGGYYGGGDPYIVEREVTLPDEERISKASRDLEALVKNTEPAVLVQFPEPVVLDKVGEVYGTDATPHFINAFNEQKADVFRDALVKFSDERALPVLKDASSIDGYVSVFTRLNNGNTLVKHLVSGKIQPNEFRENVANYIRTHLKVISVEFETTHQRLRYLVDPQYWNLDFNDFRLSLQVTENNPTFVQEVFDHPSELENWRLYRDCNSEYNCQRDRLFRGVEGVIDIFKDVMLNDKYKEYLRVYAADTLVEIKPEIYTLLVDLMDTPNCRWVAKALSKRWGSNHPQIVKSFLDHWQSIDDEDFKRCIVGIDGRIDELTAEIVNPKTSRELKAKIWNTLLSYPGVVERCHDDIKRVADYYVREGYQEGLFNQIFSEHYFSYDCMHTFYAIATNPNENPEIRTRALENIGRFKGFFNKWIKKSHREVWKYLRGASIPFFGKYIEPDPQMRDIARKVYAQVK